MALSPINQRRFALFKAHKRGWYALWLFLGLFVLSLGAELIANDKPLLVSFDGQWYAPVLKRYPETAFGGEFPLEADYKSPYMRELIESKHGWMLWPPIPYSYDSINYELKVPAPAPPSANNWLGTDDQGRDVLARVIYGFRISVLFALTLTLPYNDFDAATQLFDEVGEQIAGLIIEPIVGNANCILPREGYLQHLRELCTRHGALLIFDEVMTGFRVALGGAQQRYGIVPDLSTFGKIIGGGMPVGAYGGRRDLMSQVAPSGPIYQAGTLSGNPVAMAAGLATLDLIREPGFHDALERGTHALCDGLEAAAREAGVAFHTTRAPGMFGLYFREGPVESFADALGSDTQRFNRFFHGMLERGVYLAPSAFEAGFLSSAHGEAEIAHTLEAARASFALL